MKNRVTVTIADEEYTLVGSEEPSYTKKVAAHVDEKVREIMEGSGVSQVQGAILAAVNIADEYRGKKSVLFESCGGFEDTGVVALGVDDLAGIGLKYLYQIFKHG